MKKEISNNNNKYFVVLQERDVNQWGQALMFYKMIWDEKDKKIRWQSVYYPELATQFSTYEEAEHYAFALNFNSKRNSFDTTRFFPIEIDMTYLPKLINKIEEDEESSVSEPSADAETV